MSDTDKCKNFSPEWWRGRWRDWHRGHNCNLDDGEPCTPYGAAEFESHGLKPGRALIMPNQEQTREALT